MFAVITELP